MRGVRSLTAVCHNRGRLFEADRARIRAAGRPAAALQVHDALQKRPTTSLAETDAPRAGQSGAIATQVRFAEVAEGEALAAWREMRRWLEAGVEQDPWADTAGAG